MTSIIIGLLWLLFGVLILFAIYMAFEMSLNCYYGWRIRKLERDRKERMRNISERLKMGENSSFLPVIYEMWKQQQSGDIDSKHNDT